MASRSLRKFSPCAARLETRSSRLILVRPSTRAPICGPKVLLISSSVACGVLDRVVQHRGRDGGVVELQVGEDRRDLEGMAEEQVAGGALLVAVGHHGIDVGAVEKRLVGRGVVALHPLDEFVLAHHPAAISFAVRSNRLKLKGYCGTEQNRKAC